MKTKIILSRMFAIIAMIAVIGVGFAACVINDNGGDIEKKNEGGEETGTKTETESEIKTETETEPESEPEVIVPECLAHTYGDWKVITSAAPEDDGESERECTVCGHTQTQTIPATGNPECLHEYGEWEIIKEAACTDEGEKEKTCIMCSKSEIESIEATGHAPLSWTIKPGYRACPNTGCDSAEVVELGDTGPGGGFIFYIETNGFTVEGFTGAAGSFDSYTAYYLEAAPADMTDKLRWALSSYPISPAQRENVIEAQGMNIGTGRKNTAAIWAIASTDVNLQASIPAAYACLNYETETTNKGDWFLPSVEELRLLCNLYIEQGRNNYGNLKAEDYWSSTQYNSNTFKTSAYRCSFWGSFGPLDIAKGNLYYVRAIRAF